MNTYRISLYGAEKRFPRGCFQAKASPRGLDVHDDDWPGGFFLFTSPNLPAALEAIQRYLDTSDVDESGRPWWDEETARKEGLIV